MTDEIEKILQDKRPSKLAEYSHDKDDYDAPMSEVWQREMVKNGHHYKGAQKYHCKNCGKYGTLLAQSGDAEALRGQVKRAVRERVNLRGIELIFRESLRTVNR